MRPQRLEYITRQPAHELHGAERQLRYIQGGREDLMYANSRNLPPWAHDNPHGYFRAAERYEGKGRVAFEEWKISLPVELSHRENMALTRDLVDAIAGDRLPVTYAFHDPHTMDGRQQQPHLHVLISARQNDAYTRTPAQHFKRYQADHPERGGAQKDPAFWHRGAIKAHRVMVADILNGHLEQAGHTARVHPDRLVDRGIDRQPEPKLLPSESRQYREQGIITETMQQVLDIRAARVVQRAVEHENARTYWEERKAMVGITREMPMAERLAHVREAREHAITHAPARTPTRDLVQRPEQAVRDLEAYVQTLQRTPDASSAVRSGWRPAPGMTSWRPSRCWPQAKTTVCPQTPRPSATPGRLRAFWRPRTAHRRRAADGG